MFEYLQAFLSGIKGVVVRLIINDAEKKPGTDGYVGALGAGHRPVIELEISSHHTDNFFPFMVDGKKNVVGKRNEAADFGYLGGALYRLAVNVKRGDMGVAYTEYPANNIRVLEYKGAGRVVIWEVALVSQGGEFYLTVQPTWSVAVYRHPEDRNQTVCPAMEKWPQMADFIQERLGSVQDMKSYGNKCEDGNRLVINHNPAPESFEEKRGKVVWFNLAQGLGAIATSHGQVRVHWTSVKRPDTTLRFLVPGEGVNINALVHPQNTRARGTGFQFEAKGVTPLV